MAPDSQRSLSDPENNELVESQNSSAAGKGLGTFPAAYAALLIAVLVALGSYSILPAWLFMARIWLTDPLRAIGAVFPLVAFAGTLSAWRRIGWAIQGSFWGLPILAFSIVLSRLTPSFFMGLRLFRHNESLLHSGSIIFLYAIGAVLLFGGTRLLRAAIAPLCLLLFVNPVPYSFNQYVDLPLQFLGANTARHFAHLIGLQPTGEQLRMMFTPNFGMMIVPGCNGVRGSVTLGYLALIFGYMRRLRPRVLALVTLGAFLMGYALNLLRLCILVIYYRIGISAPSIQPYGASVDYVIGCTLFLFATLGVGLVVRWLEPEEQNTDAVEAVGKPAPLEFRLGYGSAARLACFLVITLVFIVPTLGNANPLHIALPNEQALLGSFPEQVGAYKLTRTYSEYGANGRIEFGMADYVAPPDSTGASHQLTFGLFVGPGMHLVAVSRFGQGLRPDWTGSFDATDASTQRPMTVRYFSSLYDDGVLRQYNAESACYESGCSVSIQSDSTKLLMVTPDLSDLTSLSNRKRLPILLRRESLNDNGIPTAVERARFEEDARQFTGQLNLRALVHADGTPIY